MIALGIIAAVIAAFMATRVGARVSYENGAVRLWVIFGFVKKEIRFDKPEKPPKKQKKKPEKPTETSNVPETAAETDKTADKVKKPPFIDSYDKKKLLNLALRAVPKLLKLPRIDLLELHYTAAADTADIAAIRYGKMCAALGAGLPFLYGIMRVKDKVITANIDYSKAKQEISGKIQVTVVIGSAFGLGIWALIEFLRCKKENGNGEQ